MQHLLVDLNQVFTYDVSNWPCPRGHKFEHRNKEGKLQNSFFLKLEGIDLSYLVYRISLWTFINCIHMIPLESELAPIQGVRVPCGSVVRCLTRNPGVLGSSHTRSSGFFSWECPWVRHFRAQPSTGDTRESMNNVSFRWDMAEILLKAA